MYVCIVNKVNGKLYGVRCAKIRIIKLQITDKMNTMDNTSENQAQCAIQNVMCSALCDEAKRRLISWINFFDGNMQKSFAWAIRSVKQQVEMTTYKPTQPKYKQALSDLCAMGKHYT